MLTILSPAKRLDAKSKVFGEYTQSRFPAKTRELVALLKAFSPASLQDLMEINPQLAELNADRFARFKTRHTVQNSLQALFAFNGDVFLGLEAKSLTDDSLRFAQDHLRILSGLYGVLRPLDLIQPYRLEMGTRLANPEGKNLYDFWGNQLTRMINKDLKESGTDILVNLASNEYFRAIQPGKIKGRIIEPTFREYKDGQLKFFPVFGKKARGLMARYIIDNRISDPEELKGFQVENYYFDESLSSQTEFAFVR